MPHARGAGGQADARESVRLQGWAQADVAAGEQALATQGYGAGEAPTLGPLTRRRLASRYSAQASQRFRQLGGRRFTSRRPE